MCAANAAEYSHEAALNAVTALTPNADAAALDACLDQAEAQFMDTCHREDIPAAAASTVARMAQHLYGQLGAAGLSAQSYSGQSETLLQDWPADLKRAMYRYRRLVTA